MEVSKVQKKAIEHNEGPMIVLAGPGSGKTFVITNRTRYLIEQCGVNPYSILVITFTKAAADEMKERFVKLVGSMGRAVNFGTFHAIFFTILKAAYNYKADNIIRNDLKKQVLKEIIEKQQIDSEDEKELVESLENEISLVKGEMMDITNYYATSCSEESFRNIYSEYNKRLRDSKLIDFDDMIIQCYKLLTSRSDILAAWQQKFQYILVDEFQDINRLQYEIVKLLAKPQDNLFIVGDDDQSIYRFRGAKPEIMLNFEKDYPSAKKTLLDINYRSTSCIVESACRVVKNNKNRFNKNITTINEEGTPVRIAEYKAVTDENMRIIKEIGSYIKDKSVSISEIAVLYRTNTQPRALIEKLMEYNIPFSIKDSVPSIYEHWIAKNILAYIDASKQFERFGYKGILRNTMLTIMARPNRYISRDNIAKASVNIEGEGYFVDFLKLKNCYLDKDWMIKRIDKLEYDLKILAKSKPYDAITYIRNGIEYENYLKEYAEYRKIGDEELLDIINELNESAKEYETFDHWLKHIEDYERKLREQNRNRKNTKEAISLTTFHGSKGLEFDVVFIIDANEGVTPHKKSLLEEDIEEERRMFYVAMTRARKYLHIYYVKERYKKSLEVSRFIGEIFIDKEDLIPGALIEHVRYGQGKILKYENNKLTIRFGKNPVNKVLDADFCIGNRLIRLL